LEQRRIGTSDLVCSALGFGTWEMSTTQYGQIDITEASRAVSAALDAGITLFDTAEVYGPYHSEEILGRALGARRKDIILVTKVGFRYDQHGNNLGRDSSRAAVLSHAEGCLRRLGTDCIDLLLIHWPDHQTPLAETLGALEELKAAGKIRYYGVSNFTVPMMDECQRHGHIVANQVGYHLFDRRMESRVLPACLDRKIGFMAYGTLAFGLLTGAFTPETTFVDWDWRSSGRAFGLPIFRREDFLKGLKAVERLKGLAADSAKSVAQLAIAWVLGHPAVSVALVGCRKPSEVEENVRAVDWKLSESDRAAIDRIFAEEGVPTYADADQAV
jgi:aryl-alcohol dehydrogenase-like predicted oxidoreductase